MDSPPGPEGPKEPADLQLPGARLGRHFERDVGEPGAERAQICGPHNRTPYRARPDSWSAASPRPRASRAPVLARDRAGVPASIRSYIVSVRREKSIVMPVTLAVSRIAGRAADDYVAARPDCRRTTYATVHSCADPSADPSAQHGAPTRATQRDARASAAGLVADAVRAAIGVRGARFRRTEAGRRR